MKKYINQFKSSSLLEKSNVQFLIATILVKIAPIFTLPFLLRKTGNENFNLLVFFELSCLLLDVVLSFQNKIVINRNYFKWDSDDRNIKSNLIFQKIISWNKRIFYGVLFFLFISKLINNEYIIVFALSVLYSLIFVIAQFPITILRIQNKSLEFTFYSLIILVIELSSFFAVIIFNFEFYPYYFLIKILGYSLLSIPIIYKINFNSRSENCSEISIENEFNYGKSMIIYQTLNIFYNNIDRLIIFIYASPILISSYYIITKLLTPITLFYSIIKEASTSTFFKLHADYNLNKSAIRILNLSILIPLILVSSSTYFILPFIMKILHVKDQINSELKFVVLFMIFNIIHQAINLYYFPGLHFSESYKPIKNVFFKSILFLLISLITYPYFGILSIAIGISVGELFLTINSLKISRLIFPDFTYNSLDILLLIISFFLVNYIFVIFS